MSRQQARAPRRTKRAADPNKRRIESQGGAEKDSPEGMDAGTASPPTEVGEDQELLTSKSLLFAIEHLRCYEAGRDILLGSGASEELQAEVTTELQPEQAHTQRRVLAGRLYDAPTLGLLARARLAELLVAATPEQFARLALVAQRLPRWMLETPRERAARLEAENLALALPYRGRRRRRNGSSEPRHERPLFSPGGQEQEYGGSMPPPQEMLPRPLDEDDELCVEDIPALDPTMRIVAQGRLARAQRAVGWTDPMDRLDHSHDRAVAEFIWPIAKDRADEALSDERLRSSIYNVWQQMLTTDWYKDRHPVHPETGAEFTDQQLMDGMRRMEQWKPR